MSLKRKQILDAIGRTNPTFHKIAEGHSEDEEDNVFDTAFRASNSKVEHEIKENTNFSLTIVEETDIETFDFSQFFDGDIQPSGPYRSLPRVFDVSAPNIASPSNSFDAISPSLLSSNTTSDFRSSSQIAIPCLYTGEEMERRALKTYREVIRSMDRAIYQIDQDCYTPKLRETEIPPSSPFTVNQQALFQTPANTRLSSLFYPADLSTAELLEAAPILDDPGPKTLTPRRKRKNALDARRIERAPAKKGRRPKKVKVQTKEEEAAKREKFLGRNRQAAQKCRQNKKTWVTDLLERAAFFATNNAKQPYEIELIKLELTGLRAMAVEHYRVCPNPSPELSTWFEKEVVRLQKGKGSPLIHHADGPPTPQDMDCTGQVDADMFPLMDLGSFCQGSESSAPMTP